MEYLAGAISSVEFESLTLEITVELYTPIDAQIDSITICYGDGICERIDVDMNNILGGPSIMKSYFTTTHSYPGQASYMISVAECCWSENGLNTSGFGNSIFFIQNEITFPTPLFDIANMSPISTNSINLIGGHLNEPLLFNPGFYDPNLDSISCEFIAPKGDSVVANNYLFPRSNQSGEQ